MRLDSKIVLVVSCALIAWGVHIFIPEDTITYAQPQMTPAVHSYGKLSSVGMDVLRNTHFIDETPSGCVSS